MVLVGMVSAMMDVQTSTNAKPARTSVTPTLSAPTRQGAIHAPVTMAMRVIPMDTAGAVLP